MDYQRIQKPNPQGGGGGGVSPTKLRLMLLAVEKRRKEEEEVESRCSLRSEDPEVDDRSAGSSETCKDVGMVCSTEMASSYHRSKGIVLADTRILRPQEDDAFESDASAFEFQKEERAQPHRSALVPLFSKPAPSKWDDARKWIASPTSNCTSKSAGAQPKKAGGSALVHGSRQCSTNVLDVTEVDVKEVDNKGILPGHLKQEVNVRKTMSWMPDPYPVVDMYAKPVTVLDYPVADSTVSLSQHGSSAFAQSSTTFVTPPSTIRSVSMRDTGTEMTPIASQEPSRTGTPVRDITPVLSPTSSRPSSPGKTTSSSSPIDSFSRQEDASKKELSEKDIQLKTRREIMALGTQLGKLNVAAWARKEEEDKNSSVLLNPVAVDQSDKSIIEIRASAWEEAEKAKCLARFRREEIKIQAWEDHQKAMTEAEMRKIEVKVERMRAHAHDRLMKKIATARHKVEEKRAVAEVQKNQQAARTAQQMEYISRTGHLPSSFSCCSWCK